MRRKLSNLPLFLCALPAQLLVRLGIWVLPYRLWSGLLKPAGARRSRGPKIAPARLAWSVAASSRFVPRSTCLVRALTAKLLLSWCGYPSEIRIGVAKAPGFQSHAWLVYEGEVLIGGFQPGEYTVLAAEVAP
jgi:hypothetical protein